MLSEKAMEQGKGVLRIVPAWVPRSFCRPGRRIKLHHDDYYALGLTRGAIDERWFASTTNADNGPGTPPDEGLSYVAVGESGEERILLRDMVEELKGQVIGNELYDCYGKWPMFSKYFDNLGPLPHHVHHRSEHAANVGAEGKPEMYFFPAQMNNHPGEFAFTFFGLNPGTAKEQLKQVLMSFSKGDNQLLGLSRAYKLLLDTGWDVPPGILHAPGSLCTYEPQFASDVYAMYQSVLLYEHAVPEALLWKDCPPDKQGDFDYLVEVLDWEANTAPDFYERYFMAPKPCGDMNEMLESGYICEDICYKCENVRAQRVTVLPGREVMLRDSFAYGAIFIEGYGEIEGQAVETPISIRYGALTNDEFFITGSAAQRGVRVVNHSKTQPLVMLRHYALPI